MDASPCFNASMESKKITRKRTSSKNKNYKAEAILSAENAVKTGKLSINRAARQYNVPKSTLRSRIVDHSREANSFGGSAPALPAHLEEDLVSWLHVRDEMGARVGWQELASAVEKLSLDYNVTASTSLLPSKKLHRSLPSSGWLVRFRNRHKNVPILRTKKEDWYPASQFSTSVMQEWMHRLDKRLQAAFQTNALEFFSCAKQNSIFSLGIVTFTQDSLNTSILSNLECKDGFAQLLLCFSAHCVIEPVLIIKGDMVSHWHQFSAQNKFPFDVIVSEELFNRETLISVLKRIKAQRNESATSEPTLLLFDRSLACVDVEVLKIAQESNIMLHCFPLHSAKKQPHYFKPLLKILSQTKQFDACESEETKLHFISNLWWQVQAITNWKGLSFKSCGLLPLSDEYKEVLGNNCSSRSTSPPEDGNETSSEGVVKGLQMALNIIETKCVDPKYLHLYQDFFERNESPRNDPMYSAWKELKLEISKQSITTSLPQENYQQQAPPKENNLHVSRETSSRSGSSMAPQNETRKTADKMQQVSQDKQRSNVVFNSSSELRDSVPISDRYKREFNFDSMPALNLEQHALEIMEQYQAMAGSGQLQQLVIDADTDFGTDPSLH